jgi:DnaJ-class molecular chaperone
MPLTLAVEASWLEEVMCGFCRGGGKDPFDIMSSLSSCCVCGGRGKVVVPAPHTGCAHCRGTGAIKTFTCTVCRGTGVVPAIDGPTMSCPQCRGSGDDASVPAMACLQCRGRGWLAAPRGRKE